MTLALAAPLLALLAYGSVLTLILVAVALTAYRAGLARGRRAQ